MSRRSAGNVLLGWLVTAPEGSPEPPAGDIYKLDQRKEACRKAKEVGGDGDGLSGPAVFVDLDGTSWGLVTLVRVERGQRLMRGFVQLEQLKQGKDFISAAEDPADISDVVLLKQDIFAAFLCRAWARNNVVENVRPFLGEGGTCPFDAGSALGPFASDDIMAGHYLELTLGKGPAEQCPQAKQYLQGIARDMTLSQQPYTATILEANGFADPDDSVLSVLEKLSGQNKVPQDFLEDLALTVAAKALQLVQDLGLDL